LSANSQIKKFGDRPHLYIDEATGTYLVRVYHAGTTRSKSLKTTNEKLAVQRISAAIKDIVTKDRTKLSNKLLSDYYAGFMAVLEGDALSKATMTRYSVSWRHHVEPFWANLREEQICQDAFSEYLAWHKKEKGTKLFNHLKLLRGLYKYMVQSGAAVRPMTLDLPKKEQDDNAESKGTYIEALEIAGIREAPTLSRRELLMIDLAHTFGFRIGELCNLQKDRVKVTGNKVEIRLRAIDTKTRRPRNVPLTEDLGIILIEVMRDAPGDFVFHAQRNFKRPMSKQVMDRAWLRAKESAGITRDMRFHDLRHTAATNFANLGVEPVKACAILGMTLKIYMGTSMKMKSLNLSSVIEQLEKSKGDA
jgi:integrase